MLDEYKQIMVLVQIIEGLLFDTHDSRKMFEKNEQTLEPSLSFGAIHKVVYLNGSLIIRYLFSMVVRLYE